LEKIFLRPGPFIQSDDQKIRDLAREILKDEPDAPPLTRAKKLLDWVFTHIEKRPVLSLPDALSTLENRVGDCNEHAVLLAALARAAGIPTRIEAGAFTIMPGISCTSGSGSPPTPFSASCRRMSAICGLQPAPPSSSWT
jgi:transglutaminase-like putative cysteine protease